MSSPAAADARSRILVVDDLPMFRELQTRFLVNAGNVATASTGAEALALARVRRPEVILAAFSLPDIEGDALCKEIKGDPRLAEVAVILVVGSHDGEARARAIRAGADDVLSKPLARLSLIASVSRFLRVPIARALVRAPLEVPVRIRIGDEAFEARSRNISRGGIYVETERSFDTGAEMDLEFHIPDTEQAIATTARVMWKQGNGSEAPEPGDGVGLQFLRIDGDDARRVEDYVAIHAPRRPC